jgi:hypothetical protein
MRLFPPNFFNIKAGHVFDARVSDGGPGDAERLDSEYRKIVRHMTR